MKHFIAFISLSLFVCALWAQYDDIYRGVQKTHKGYYDEAIGELEAGLKDLSVLSDKDKAKAYTHLAISYLHAGTDPSMQSKFKDPLLRAVFALRQAEATDKDKSYQKSLSSISPLLQTALYNEAAIAYNQKNYKKAQNYIDASIKMDEKDYTARAVMGLCLLAQNKARLALPYLEKSIDMFAASGRKANAEIASAFTQAAALRLKQDDPQNAQKIAQQGISKLQAYPDATRELTLIDLVAFEKSPNPLSRGRKAFEQALKKYPDAHDVRLSYASLLIEQGDEKDQAKGYALMQEYQQRFPDAYQANAYMARYYVNKAQKVAAQMTPGMADKPYNELEASMISELEKAYPFVKKAYEKQPADPQWIQQLVSISTHVPKYQGEQKKWENVRGN